MDPSHLQQVIDADGSIRTLKVRRNTLAPISSLPAEILCAIFSLLHVPRGASSPFAPEKGPDQRDRLAWLRVAHVCHQWREIVLDQPLFWSHIDFTAVNSAGAAEILARAKTAPLYLEARVPLDYWNDIQFTTFQKEIQDHVSHICHLDIGAELTELCRILRGLVSPAPTLEYLSLSSDAHGGRNSSVPDNLFNGATPRLTCLELSRWGISWTSPLLRGLKHLKIRSPHGSPTLSEWLDALDEMPRLETLVLDSASPMHWLDRIIVERTATLPSLTHLDISADADDCSLALAHLVLPALTSLHLSAWSLDRTHDDVQELLPHFARHAHGPQDTRPLQSMLIRGEREDINVFAWSVPDIDVEVHDQNPLSPESARVALSVTTWLFFTRYDTIMILDKAMTTLPLGNLVTLTAQRRARLDIQFWLRHAPRWPLLRRVRLAQLSAQGFVEMLLEDNHGGCGNPLLPSLTRLDLVEIALNARRMLRLCDALMRRVEQGLPLEVLDLRTCSMTSLAVRLLSEIVVDVWGPAETLESDDVDDNDSNSDYDSDDNDYDSDDNANGGDDNANDSDDNDSDSGDDDDDTDNNDNDEDNDEDDSDTSVDHNGFIGSF